MKTSDFENPLLLLKRDPDYSFKLVNPFSAISTLTTPNDWHIKGRKTDIFKNLDKITYKPSVFFHWKEQREMGGTFDLTIFYYTFDSRPPHTWQHIRESHMVDFITTDMAHDPKSFVKALLAKIKKLEAHEAEEWMKIDGKHVVNPHRKEDFGSMIR